MARIIVTLSGGKASAWCADWTLKNFPKEDVVLYFNDTKWEHKDLYRFLNDLSKYWGKEIFSDSDGRSPEDLFYSEVALPNNRMPFCSKILKAKRLQKFYKDGDTLVFGIGIEERHRAKRLQDVYDRIGDEKDKYATLLFPLIQNNMSKDDVDAWLKSTGIKQPYLYTIGFPHNNCSGGCVRAGKKHWKLVHDKLPEVYAERERAERDFRLYLGRDISIMKGETLEHFRYRIETGQLSKHYLSDDEEEGQFECIGICESLS